MNWNWVYNFFFRESPWMMVTAEGSISLFSSILHCSELITVSFLITTEIGVSSPMFLNNSGFHLTIRHSYFTILVEVFKNHILAQNTYFTNHTELTEHKIMVFKLANKYQIIWQRHHFKNILIDDFQHHPILYRATLLQTSVFTEPKITNRKDETMNHSNICLLFDLLCCQKDIS